MSVPGNAGLRNVSTRIKWNPDITRAKGLGKCVFYYGGFVISEFFSVYILLLLGLKISFFILGSSL